MLRAVGAENYILQALSSLVRASSWCKWLEITTRHPHL